MAVPTMVAKAKPIDWVSVALAFSMPILVALEPYVQGHSNPALPPVGTALLVAALGSLIAQLGVIQRKRAAAE